eukprot:14513858-Ditylum_brightwellii.AAC.1
MGSTPTATTESIIHKTEEAATQAQANIGKLEACGATSSTRCTTTTVPNVTPVELFETKFVKLDVALAGHTIVTLICRGIFKDMTHENQPIIPWSGTDPDRQINYFS